MILNPSTGYEVSEALSYQSGPVPDRSYHISGMNIVIRLRKSPFLFAVIDFEFYVGRYPTTVSPYSQVLKSRDNITHQVDCVGLRSVPRISARGYWSPGQISHQDIRHKKGRKNRKMENNPSQLPRCLSRRLRPEF